MYWTSQLDFAISAILPFHLAIPNAVTRDMTATNSIVCDKGLKGITQLSKHKNTCLGQPEQVSPSCENTECGVHVFCMHGLLYVSI